MEEGVVTMIRIENLTKSYPSKMGPQYIFKNLNFDFPTENNVAILGKNGAGKSTLFRMLAKSEYPDKGRVLTNKSMSWPVALQTGVHPQMTGREKDSSGQKVRVIKSGVNRRGTGVEHSLGHLCTSRMQADLNETSG